MAPPSLLLHPSLLIFLHFPLATSQASAPISFEGCRNKCGNITVPYSFGLEPVCFREGFNFTCNESYDLPRLFLHDSHWFHYNKSYLTRTKDFEVQEVLDRTIRNVGNCSYARCNLTNYACQSTNHDCNNSQNGTGYLCSCSKGYQGNLYITGRYQDVNDCDIKGEYPSFGDCKNTIGSFIYNCPRGIEGNAPMKDGCRKKDKFTLTLKIVTGDIVGVLFVAFACLGDTSECRIGGSSGQIKQWFFEQNGGLLLQQQKSSFKNSTFKIYSKEELEQATNKFSEERMLRHGDPRIVYKGSVEDGNVAAIQNQNKEKNMRRKSLRKRF